MFRTKNATRISFQIWQTFSNKSGFLKFSLYVQIKLRVYIKKEHMKAVSHVEAVTAKSGFVGEFDLFLVNIFVATLSLTRRLHSHFDKHFDSINFCIEKLLNDF